MVRGHSSKRRSHRRRKSDKFRYRSSRSSKRLHRVEKKYTTLQNNFNIPRHVNVYGSISFVDAMNIRTTDAWIDNKVKKYDSILKHYLDSLQPAIKIANRIHGFVQTLRQKNVKLRQISAHHVRMARQDALQHGDNVFDSALRLFEQRRWWAQDFTTSVEEIKSILVIRNDADRLYQMLIFLYLPDISRSVSTFNEFFTDRALDVLLLPDTLSAKREFISRLLERLKTYIDPYDVVAYYRNGNIVSAKSLSDEEFKWSSYKHRHSLNPKPSEILSHPDRFQPLVKDAEYEWFEENQDVSPHLQSQLANDVHEYYKPSGQGAQLTRDHFLKALN